MIRLFPPLIKGSLGTKYGDRRGHDVSGRVVGRRGALVVVDKVVSWITPSMLHLPQPWAVAHLRFGHMRAAVGFGVDSWKSVPYGLEVVELDSDLVPWLRSFMDNAERTLCAHTTKIGSVDTAWELARLHLIFKELEDAKKAAMRSVELLKSSRQRPKDPAVGLRLIDQFCEFNCRNVAAALRAALSD